MTTRQYSFAARLLCVAQWYGQRFLNRLPWSLWSIWPSTSEWVRREGILPHVTESLTLSKWKRQERGASCDFLRTFPFLASGDSLNITSSLLSTHPGEYTSNLQDDFKEKETSTLQEESEGDSEILWSGQLMNQIQKKQYCLYHFCAFHRNCHYDEKNSIASRLNRHEFEQTPGDSGEQKSLACCSPWGHKELDMT